MSSIPAQFFQKVRDETELVRCDRFLTLRAIRRNEPSLWHGLIRIGEKPFESHLLKAPHHLLKTFLGQLGCTFHPGHSLKDLVIGFLIQMEIFFCNMYKSFFLSTDWHPFHYNEKG